MDIPALVCSYLFSFMMHISVPQPIKFNGTRFGPPEFDRFNTGDAACLVHVKPSREARVLMRRGAYIAKRKGTCWDEYYMLNPRTGRHEIVVLADAGPYGRNRDGIDIWEGTEKHPGVARRVLHNGDEPVYLMPTGRNLAAQRKDNNVREEPKH